MPFLGTASAVCKPFAFWRLRGRTVASFATLGPTFDFCFFWSAVNIEEAHQWAVGFAGENVSDLELNLQSTAG